MRQIRSYGEIDLHGSELPFLNPSSPWFSLLQNECDRVGASATSLMMSRIRRALDEHALCETFALVYYWRLLEGDSGEGLRSGCLSDQWGSKHWIRRWLEADRGLAAEIDEYLFFAFYRTWSSSPPADITAMRF